MKVEIQSKSDIRQRLEITDVNQILAVSIIETTQTSEVGKTIFFREDQLDEIINALIVERNVIKGVVNG